MRVVWFTHRDPTGDKAGGAERTIREVASRLTQEGYVVRVISPAARHPKSDKSREDTGIFWRYPVNPLTLHALHPLLVRTMSDADVIIDDLAHAVPWATPLFTEIPVLAFFRHLHAATLPLQVGPVQSRLLALAESSYPHLYPSSTFVTESQGSVESLLSLGIEPSRVVRLPPGVDLELFKPGTSVREQSAVYFAGLKPHKRPEHAIELVRTLMDRYPKLTLTIIGDGPCRHELEERVRSLNLQDRVSFTGRLADPELAEVVRHCRVNVVTSIHEGWCLTALEAAASGVPTVCYAVPGLLDSVSHGLSGLLVPNGDSVALAAAADTILSSPASDWAHSCRTWAEQFGWQRAIHSWKALLRATSDYSCLTK